MPPDHFMDRFGSKLVTLTGKVRSGLTLETTLIVSPAATLPSTGARPSPSW